MSPHPGDIYEVPEEKWIYGGADKVEEAPFRFSGRWEIVGTRFGMSPGNIRWMCPVGMPFFQIKVSLDVLEKMKKVS